MPRPLFAVGLLLLCAAALTAQEKKPDAPPALYPLAKGTKWEYAVKSGDQTQTATVEVTAVTEAAKDLPAVATLTTKLPMQTLVEELSADDKGVYRHAVFGQKLQAPLPILRYPLAEGGKWTADANVGGTTTKIAFEVKKADTVKLKGGEYKAQVVEMKFQTAGQAVVATNWYADGVGLVKQDLTVGDFVTNMELTKFTAAGK